jgi:L-iditol 2-dehydrogenase
MIGLVKLAPGAGNLRLSERDLAGPEPGQALLRVIAAGVCGTDLHIGMGEYPARPPVTLGHEVAGVVEQVGDAADERLVGKRVVAETFFSTCGQCIACREGRRNLCPERISIGSHVDGAFASHVVVPVANLHLVPDHVEDSVAALAEPLACVCQCLLSPPVVGPGDRVLIVGPGPVGALAAQVARALGGEVIVAGLSTDAGRLEILRDLGFSVTTSLRSIEAVEVAVEASGSESGAAGCLDRLAKGGHYVQVGLFGRPVEIAADEIVLKELQITAGFASTPRSWRQAMALLDRGAIELAPLVTEIAPLRDWERVFDELRAGRGMKVVFDPRLI